MSWRQTAAIIVGVALLAAAVCWFLEGFNRQRLIDDFKAQLDQLPEFKRGDAAYGPGD